jgi:hypothetical protein
MGLAAAWPAICLQALGLAAGISLQRGYGSGRPNRERQIQLPLKNSLYIQCIKLTPFTVSAFGIYYLFLNESLRLVNPLHRVLTTRECIFLEAAQISRFISTTNLEKLTEAAETDSWKMT